MNGDFELIRSSGISLTLGNFHADAAEIPLSCSVPRRDIGQFLINHKKSSAWENFRDDPEGKRKKQKKIILEGKKWLCIRKITNGPGIICGQHEEKGCFSDDVRLII